MKTRKKCEMLLCIIIILHTKRRNLILRHNLHVGEWNFPFNIDYNLQKRYEDQVRNIYLSCNLQTHS